MNNLKQITIFFFAAVTLIFLWSCEDNKPDDFGRTPYDPSKPVVIDGFKPDSGGLATKVLIEGSNFGSDLSQIKVYFTATTEGGTQVSMLAPLIGSDGEHMYVLTPKLTNLRECTVSVVSNGDSAVYTDKNYLYRTMTTVTTIAGKKGTTSFRGGTLAEAQFSDPVYMCIDDEDNIFVCHWYTPFSFILINEEKDIVQQLLGGISFNIPTIDAQGKVFVPVEAGDTYYHFDPAVQWASKQSSILHPTADMIAEGMLDFNIDYKVSMANCFYDGYIYTSTIGTGQLIKMNPVSRIGQLVTSIPWSSTRLFFDPYQSHILYIIAYTLHAIYKYDVITGEETLFAGTPGVAGWKDGKALEAEFARPSMMVITEDGSMYLSDRDNHCIRRITPDGMVSTVIGQGGVLGYQDGNAEDALFNEPFGLAISKKTGAIYVSDWRNNCIRKLAIE